MGEIKYLCDVSTTDFPSFNNEFITFHKNFRAPGSIPVVGSSYVFSK